MVRIKFGGLRQDIKGFTDVSLGPGKEFSFKAFRILSYPGDFQAQVMAKLNGSWVRIKNNIHVGFKACRYGWRPESSGTNAWLNSVSVLDTSHFRAVGEEGTVIFYNGNSWSRRSSGTSNELLAVHAIAPSYVWAVGRNGTIRVYDGISWTWRNCGLNIELTEVFAASRSLAWVSGDGYESGGYIMGLTDGGGHWSAMCYEEEYFFTSIDVTNKDLMWITGADDVTADGGFVWERTDGGTTLHAAAVVHGWYGDVDAVGASRNGPLGNISKSGGS